MWTKRIHYLTEVSEHLILSEKIIIFLMIGKVTSSIFLN